MPNISQNSSENSYFILLVIFSKQNKVNDTGNDANLLLLFKPIVLSVFPPQVHLNTPQSLPHHHLPNE